MPDVGRKFWFLMSLVYVARAVVNATSVVGSWPMAVPTAVESVSSVATLPAVV